MGYKVTGAQNVGLMIMVVELDVMGPVVIRAKCLWGKRLLGPEATGAESPGTRGNRGPTLWGWKSCRPGAASCGARCRGLNALGLEFTGTKNLGHEVVGPDDVNR